MVNVLIRESYGNEEDSERLYVDNESNRWTVIDRRSEGWLTIASIKMLFTSVFLPAGYPDSVSSDYIEYQLWDSIQAFASSLMHNLATHAVLKGVGVGDSSATVLAATITWLLRDGTSMIGGILFTYIQSSKLDTDCKKWRLFADLINDISIMIDLLSPYFSDYFMFMQCLSGVLKSLVGTAGGATRAALTQHQSRRNNLADVSAKDGSQETLVNLTALICSLIIVPVVSTNSNLVWLLFISFTLLHIYANYRAVKSVSLETFNLKRFAIFVENYLKTNGNVLSVKTTNNRENVWFFIRDSFDVYNEKIAIGVSLRDHISQDIRQLNALIDLYTNQKDCQYVLSFDRKNKIPINISLKKNFDSSTLLESTFHAILIYFAQKTNEKIKDSKLRQIIDEINSESNDSNNKVLELTRKYTIDSMKRLRSRALEEGWDLDKVLITPNEWRFQI